MTRHQQLYKIYYPIYNKLASIVDDIFWKSFFTNLSVNAFKKGGIRINSEILREGEKNTTVLSITPIIKKNTKVFKMELKDTDDETVLKTYADEIMQYMETFSTLYSGVKNDKVLGELKSLAGGELMMRRKMDRSIMYTRFLSNKLHGSKKSIKKAFKCLMAIPTIKSSSIIYDDNGDIEDIEGIDIDAEGCVTVLNLKEKEEPMYKRKKILFYAEKLLKANDKKYEGSQ